MPQRNACAICDSVPNDDHRQPVTLRSADVAEVRRRAKVCIKAKDVASGTVNPFLAILKFA